MNKTLSVSAIQDGTVIDHIKAGNALRILSLLGLVASHYQMTLGLNLPSKRIGRKDLIKIESLALTPEQANEVVIFAPNVTINIVKNFEVIEKIKTHLPTNIRDVFICPNLVCISQEKNIGSAFYIEEQAKQMVLTCHYCERSFDRDQLKVKI
jgi:aspartate carbamoyltransferase regulatory subunit